MHADWNVAEFSIRSVATGILLGLVFAASNVYIGLRTGFTMSASIPAAAASLAVFSALRAVGARGATMLEKNISQSIGSAGQALAAGIVFTVPALILSGEASWWSFSLYAGLGGVLGVLCMVPLRRYLVTCKPDHLVYPEGEACARVIRASDRGGMQARFVFTGLGVAAAYQTLMAALGLWKTTLHYSLPGFRAAVVSCSLSPAYLGVGYILGFRSASLMLSGGLISSLVIIPLIARFGAELENAATPGTSTLVRGMSATAIWSHYVRYVGAGALVFAGGLTLVRALPGIAASVRAGFGGATAAMRSARLRTDHDLSFKAVFVGVGVITALCAFIPGVSLGIVAAVFMLIFALFFVTVSSRVVAQMGTTSNPIAAMTMSTLLGTGLLAVFLGPGGEPHVKMIMLLIGALVSIAAAVAGDTSQDLKTGFLIGATPWKQQVAELVGVLTSMFVVGLVVMSLHDAYTVGSEELSAPHTTLMQLAIDGVLERNVPWELVFAGIMIGVVFELCRVPALPVAVGLYLPLATTLPICIGGVVRMAAARMAKGREETTKERGLLLGSGLMGGEGIVAVVLALLLNSTARPFVENTLQMTGRQWWLALGAWGDTLSLLAFTALVLFLVRQAVGHLRA